MKKKIVLSIMALIFALGTLCACGSSSAPAENTDQGDAAGDELTIAGENMEKLINAYADGDMDSVAEYRALLPDYADDLPLPEMSEMEGAIYADFADVNFDMNLVDEYIYDVDNDGKVELLVLSGTCEADYELSVHKIINDQVEDIGKIGGGHSIFIFYPNHEGFLRLDAHMGCEQLCLESFENGGIKETLIGERGGDPGLESDEYLDTGCVMQSIYDVVGSDEDVYVEEDDYSEYGENSEAWAEFDDMYRYDGWSKCDKDGNVTSDEFFDYNDTCDLLWEQHAADAKYPEVKYVDMMDYTDVPIFGGYKGVYYIAIFD